MAGKLPFSTGSMSSMFESFTSALASQKQPQKAKNILTDLDQWWAYAAQGPHYAYVLLLCTKQSELWEETMKKRTQTQTTLLSIEILWCFIRVSICVSHLTVVSVLSLYQCPFLQSPKANSIWFQYVSIKTWCDPCQRLLLGVLVGSGTWRFPCWQVLGGIWRFNVFLI